MLRDKFPIDPLFTLFMEVLELVGIKIDPDDLLTRESTRFPDCAVIANWWQMRMMALTGDAVGALRMLKEALAKGHWYHEDALHNIPDLATLQGMPEFENLVARCRNCRLKAIAEAEPYSSGRPG